ncbi:hypothetical protein E1301_Tti011871 [Triplophysa tibetana]|uniref:Uncharacterized protein n=1 Tax=Triplophysa tibetana TaxID=1572043 RepID=A0A5A9PNG3_9TELE|nr:hypothetical protein E1301_Tti011871 [Triplophysa tibetana]
MPTSRNLYRGREGINTTGRNLDNSRSPPDCSADLARWEPVLKCQTAEGVISCSDMEMLGALSCFYRFSPLAFMLKAKRMNVFSKELEGSYNQSGGEENMVSRGGNMNRKHVVSVGGVGMPVMSLSAAVSLQSEAHDVPKATVDNQVKVRPLIHFGYRETIRTSSACDVTKIGTARKLLLAALQGLLTRAVRMLYPVKVGGGIKSVPQDVPNGP